MTYPPPGYGQPSQPRRPQVPQPGYGQPSQPLRPQVPPSPPPRNGLGTAGLVLGIVGLVFAFIPIVGVIAWPLVIIGLILGVLGVLRANRGQATNRGGAIAGVACSALGLVICFAWATLFAAAIPVTPTTTSAAGARPSSGTQQREAPASAPTATQQNPTVIQVTQMGDDFEANQVAAEKKWGGKYVQFTASVSNINSSGITFGDVTSKFSFTQVSCDLEDENAMLSLAKGKPATVRGIVDDDQLLGVISLNQCEVVGAGG
jgi:uncharacterized iron-regulated membrane protein